MSVKISGWTLHAHQCFIDQVEALATRVEQQQRADPDGYRNKKQARLLASIYALMTMEIPGNPASPAYEQGNTLGKARRHWKRAKFNERFRLFFQYQSSLNELVYAWVNDQDTLRKRGSKTDAYAVFTRMIAAGQVPDSWAELAAAAARADGNFEAVVEAGGPHVG